MISCPAKWFLGNPGPTGISVNPMAVRVRTPIAFASLAGLPNVTIVTRFDPRAMGLEPGVKQVVGRFVLTVRFDGNRLTRRGGCHLVDPNVSRRIIGKRFFPRIQLRFPLLELLLLLHLTFRGEAILNLAVDLRLPLLFGLLFLARRQKRGHSYQHYWKTNSHPNA